MTDFFNPAAPNIVFVDLATFSEVDGFLYGGPMASTWFVAGIIKSNWFGFVSVPLRSIGVAPIFGARRSPFGLTRQADYALNSTLRAKFPAIGFSANIEGGQPLLRWVNNLMHNLIKHVQLEFNDLTVEEFDCWWLDVNYEYRTEGAKRVAYKTMIGAIPTFTSPVGPGQFLPGGTLHGPLPFFYTNDSGFSLPVAALPFNEIKITFDFRDWKELIMIDPAGVAVTVNDVVTYVNGEATTDAPTLSNVEVWTHYAVVHQDERSKMGQAPRDIAMVQVQTIQATPFKDITSRTSFDIRMSHPIIAFFFLAQNVSLQNTFSGTLGHEQSNYTTLSDLLTTAAAVHYDPLAYATLSYENQSRMSDITGYFSYIVPWYWSLAIPEVTGYHAGSYALQMWNACHPSGSSDYSKLANVSISYNGSPAAIQAAGGLYPDGSSIAFASTPAQTAWRQSWNHVFMASNWNIGRVSHGSFGFPAL